MRLILLISIIVGLSLQGILKKAYNNRVQGGYFIFSAVSVLFGAITFFVIGI